MSENAKTGAFWAVAAVVAMMATVVSWPRSTETTNAASMIGKPMFEDFKDVLEVALLKIDRFDEAMGQLSSFEVIRDSKSHQWTIPSHDDYPADAVEQIRDTATAFLNLEILDVASEVKEDHAKFGVVEPNDDSLKVGDEGVGTLVQIKDQKGTSLVDLVVGSSVKDSDNQRFVRVPTQDVTYVVKFDDKVVTSKFEDWIEDNLLDMSSIDIKRVEIDDYSVFNMGVSAALRKKFNAQLSVEDNGTWKLEKMVAYEKGKEVPQELKEDEELDSAKLNTLKTALSDLKIVDVRRKPDGLSADLRANANFMNDSKAVQSLQRRGFYPQPGEDDKGEVYSANGELRATLNDGVQYLLRFGEIDQSLGSAQQDEDDSVTGLNRYLLVTARIDERSLTEPQMDPLPKSWDELHPELQATKEPAVEKPAPTKNPPQAKDTKEDPKADAGKEKPADAEKKSDEAAKKPDDAEKKADEAEKKADDAAVTDDSSDASDVESADSADADVDSASDDSKPSDDTAADSEASDNAKADADTKAATDAKPDTDAQTDADAKEDADAKKDADAKASDEKPAADKKQLTEEEKKEELEIAQEKVRKANQRKMDEYQEKLEAAKLKVRKLNERFADWYYVVSESEYRKVHLSRTDLVKTKAPADASPAAPGGFAPGQMPPQFGLPPGN